MNKLAKSLILGTALFILGSSKLEGQTRGNDLQHLKVTIQMEKQAFGTIVAYLMERYDITIGFEQSTLDRSHSDYKFQTNLPSVGKKVLSNTDGSVELNVEVERIFTAKKHPITLDLENVRLSDALDQIVRQMKHYSWEISDGVVNIFPVKGRDKRFEDLLDSEIERFRLPKGNTVREITFTILKLREFNIWLHKNNLHFNGVRAGSEILLDAQYGRSLDADLTFAKLRFRNLLNQITKSKRGGWILKWKSTSANGEEHIDLDI